ncbi:MAG: exodeoxyribonuclease V subunit gamma, partial [Gammaproteobacteria bacterium]|nr:exodeoxyribonuclease V subunit gamma [Gammaproteobacteria bacterium]
MLHLHLSNRVSIFIDQLIDILEKSPRPQVLARRHVVVPSMLVAKYLNLQLAQKQGIAANIQYLLPAEYIWKALADLQLELPAQAQFESSVLHWRIYAWLCKAENIQNYSELNSYLDPSPSSRRRTFQLAAEVAGLFNKYLIYRADLLYQWQRKRDQSDWQAALWFDLRQKAAEAFWGDLPELLAVIDFSQLPFSNLLSQATVFFGVADFSPGYLAVLEKIAGISELHLMLMNPSSYYWGDDLSTKTRSLHELMLAQRGQDSQLSYLDEGNRLLASLGQHRDQQFDLIWSLNPQEIDAYEPPTGSSLLSLLQQNLYEPGEVATQAYAKPINSDDQSLLIHSCHSPLRELQVLYDYLLDCFQTMPELQMHEVLVVVPQLDQYAGFIPSVFKYGAGPSMGFCISDSQDSFLQSVRDILHKLLTLNQKLLDVTWLNDVLHYPLIRANFELTQQDLSKLQFYMEKLAIYWGVDGAELAQQELPQHLNTWDAGIQRWMLGYAMGDVSPNMFNDLLPMPDVDPGDSDLFSKFLLFYNKLLQLKSNLLEARSIEEWRQTCQQMVDDFFYFEADELVAKIQLNQALDQLVQASESAQFSEVLPLPVFIQALEQIFATRQANIVLHQDAIVFAAPHQVNNIEFKVIAMLGMNADAYPRPQTQLIFDHSLQDKRLGDANPRDLDRDYFLQCL